jgi:hypothetical protein
MIEIEAKIFALADQLRADCPDAARAVVALIEPMREWWQRQRKREQARRSEYARKMMDFHNTAIEGVYEETAAEIEHERDRILRIFAIDERWTGSYADLVALVKESTP